MINTLTNLFVKSAYANIPEGTGYGGGSSTSDIVGTIELPAGIPSEISQTGDIISTVIRFMIIIGGIFTVWQFISGGLTYITSNGDKGKVQEANTKITMSVVGLVIMAASVLIIAIISKLLFGSFTAILIPKFTTVN